MSLEGRREEVEVDGRKRSVQDESTHSGRHKSKKEGENWRHGQHAALLLVYRVSVGRRGPYNRSVVGAEGTRADRRFSTSPRRRQARAPPLLPFGCGLRLSRWIATFCFASKMRGRIHDDPDGNTKTCERRDAERKGGERARRGTEDVGLRPRNGTSENDADIR